jgi:hypothetical protein
MMVLTPLASMRFNMAAKPGAAAAADSQAGPEIF